MAENKMGVMPVKKLIVNMSLPMMASMLVQALYNVVDSVFVSRFDGSYALTAVTLAFPMQNLMFSLAGGTAVGINALLSKSLGERNFERVDKTANNGILITFLSSFIFILGGLLIAKPFIASQTDNAKVLEYGTSYLRIVMIICVGLYFQVILERLLQSTGLTFYSMISQMSGALINIIFDPIMIFGLFGFPRLGVAGAAWATVLGQCCAALISLFLNLKFNKEIHISVKGILSPDTWIIGRIYAVGIPSFLMIGIGSIMTFSMNMILKVYGGIAQAVFGAYFKLQSFLFMPIFGLNNGVIPVLAFNYGARRKDRIDEALRFSMTLAVTIMLIGTVVMETIPGTLLSLFNASEEMLKVGIPALRIIGIHFPLAGASIVMGSIFQAFSRSIYSLFISVTRQLLVLVPAAFLLSKLVGLDGVWFAFPVAEVASLIASVIFFRKVYGEVAAEMAKAQ